MILRRVLGTVERVEEFEEAGGVGGIIDSSSML